MTANILYMLGELPAPVIILIVNAMIWRNPPQMNENIGYRTKGSQKSEEAWNAAQTIYGKYGTVAYVVVLAATLAADIAMILISPSEGARFASFIIIVSVQCAAFIPVIAMVEHKLNMLFDENGKLKQHSDI